MTTDKLEPCMRCQGQTAIDHMPMLLDGPASKLTRIVVCPECRDELRGIIKRANAGDKKDQAALSREQPEFQEPIFHALLEDWEQINGELVD
jgi:hypothetical protein